MTSEEQRKAAAEIARKKVLASFDNSEKLKDEKISPKTGRTISNEEWKKYHSAWQNYYQNYYNNYYSSAAKQYLAKEKLKSDRKAAEEKEALKELSPKSSPDTASPSDKLRAKIRSRASDTAVMARRRKKLLPLFIGVVVVLVLLFLQYNRLIFAPIAAYVSPGDAPASEITPVDPTVAVSVSSDPKLIIPKLNVEVPVAFGIGLDEVMPAMNRGVAHYRINGANAFPGEIGNTVITGHSAGDIYSNNQYKFIFSGLERLEEGDLAYINYNSTRYTYRVTKKEVVDPTNVSSLVYPTEKPLLTLVTCTPLGTSKYRLLVTAEQISPSFDSAPTSAPTVDSDSENNLPSNEPSLFENFWNLFTGN